jgi:hypothetical protein
VAYELQVGTGMLSAPVYQGDVDVDVWNENQQRKERRGSARLRLIREAVVKVGALNVLVVVRDLSASGLLVETDYLLGVGECGVLTHIAGSAVEGHTLVRVVRHTTGPSGKLAMGLEVLWQRETTRDISGLFAL